MSSLIKELLHKISLLESDMRKGLPLGTMLKHIARLENTAKDLLNAYPKNVDMMDGIVAHVVYDNKIDILTPEHKQSRDGYGAGRFIHARLQESGESDIKTTVDFNTSPHVKTVDELFVLGLIGESVYRLSPEGFNERFSFVANDEILSTIDRVFKRVSKQYKIDKGEN